MGLFRRKPKPKPDPLIRWYGKLPVYGDYYHSDSGEEWVAEFTQKWLMNGYQVYEGRRRNSHPHDAPASASPQTGQRMPACGCILQLPQTGMTVLASCLDFGGDTVGRKFPLCFFVGYPTADLPSLSSGAILPYMGVLTHLLGLSRRVARFLNDPGVKGPEQFRAEFADQEALLDPLSSPPSDLWMERARGIKLTDWYSATGDTLGTPGLEAWLRRAAQWGERLARSDSSGFKATLSFPLAPERVQGLPRIDRDAQVAGWLRWLEGRMDLAGRALSLVLTEEPAPACSRLTIILGELAPDDFLLLTPLATSLEHVDDLAAVREADAADDSAPAADAAAASTPDTWADFVGTDGKVELKV